MARLDPSAPLSASDSVQRAVKEFRRLPEDDERMIRWGFIGAFGKDGVDGAEHWACSIHTMKQEEYFNGPNASDENLAVFADASPIRTPSGFANTSFFAKATRKLPEKK